MDGENNENPYEQIDDLGVPLFLETTISKTRILCINVATMDRDKYNFFFEKGLEIKHVPNQHLAYVNVPYMTMVCSIYINVSQGQAFEVDFLIVSWIILDYPLLN